jgi:5'-deoxynucleotidase YfbR-like HD superfamily hydrolase
MTRSARLHADGLVRCPWPGEDPFYMTYHDTEWGVPEYDDRALYEKLILDGFQAGLSWITILRKRDNFRRAFDDFRPEKIARYNAKKLHALMNDAGIVRNRAKIGQRAGIDAAVDPDVEGTDVARIQICRPDHRLCLHAGHRHGQRPSGDLLLPCNLRRKTSHPAPQSQMTARKLSAAETSPRVWQRMLSGRRLDLLDPSPLDIEIVDIAHGLARVARWNGQTSGAHIFSVAQHTLLVEAVMREQTPCVDVRLRLAALLHDAPEYVIGDMISPFKAVLGGDYRVVEKRLLSAIHIRFGLPPVLADEVTRQIKAADKGAAYLEATQLAGFAEAEAKRLFGRDPGLPPASVHDYLTPWTAARAEKRFLARFKTLLP